MAERFFGLLRESGAERLVDVRLRNTSGLSGFAKKDDLVWFLWELCEMDYIHLPQLAPTGEMLDAYRKEHKSWEVFGADGGTAHCQNGHPERRRQFRLAVQ